MNARRWCRLLRDWLRSLRAFHEIKITTQDQSTCRLMNYPKKRKQMCETHLVRHIGSLVQCSINHSILACSNRLSLCIDSSPQDIYTYAQVFLQHMTKEILLKFDGGLLVKFFIKLFMLVIFLI